MRFHLFSLRKMIQESKEHKKLQNAKAMKWHRESVSSAFPFHTVEKGIIMPEAFFVKMEAAENRGKHTGCTFVNDVRPKK